MNKLKDYKFLIKLAVSGGILVILFSRMDRTMLEDLADHIQASAWTYATLLVLLQTAFLSLRWMYLLNIGHRRMNFPQSIQMTLTSMLANMLFISSIGGIFVRVALALQYGATLFKSVLATAIDRMMTLAALVLLTALFLPTLGNYIEGGIHETLSYFTGATIITIFVFTPLFLRVVLANLPRLPMAERNVRSARRYLQVLLTDYVLMGKVVGSSLVAQMCFFVAIYCISISAGVSLSFLQLMTVLPVIALVASLPISFGGWGLREGAFVYGYGLLGVPMETAFLISVQIGLISMLATIVAGIPAILTTDTDALGIHSRSLMTRLKKFRT